MNYIKSIRLLRRGAICAALSWSLVVLASILLLSYEDWQQVMQTGVEIGKATMQKDIMYRDWNAANGGVYLRVSQNVEPNPYLAHVPDRDVITSSNQELTLVNPAYMTKLVHKTGPDKYSLRTNLTSNKPLNKSNLADRWESNALKRLEKGVIEVAELVTIEDAAYMRIMMPLWVDKPCLKCHGKQGYHVGDLRGGISVTVPMDEFLAETSSHIIEQVVAGGAIFFVGLIGVYFFYYLFKTQLYKYSLSEKKAGQLQDQWNSTFDEITDIISIQNSAYEIQRMNKAGLKSLNLQAEDVVGKKCYKLFFDAEAVCPGCYASVDKIDHFFPYLKEVRRSDNRVFLVSVAPVRGGDGSVNGNVHMAKDISRTRELENRLQQSQKMEAIGTLAGGIAHDFNNILTAILGFSEMIKDELPDQSQAKENIMQVLKAGMRAKDLVNQILTFSRQFNRDEERPVQVRLIAQEVVELLRSTIPRSITIKENFAEQCRPIMAEPSKIHQVIMNLCTNAYQAMGDEGGELRISVGEIRIGPDKIRKGRFLLEPDEYLQLIVSDTGHGILEEKLKRIFEPYFTTKKKGEGTGLGLATVHGIVESLGGQVTVKSVVGKGTEFNVVLPLSKIETDHEKDHIEESLPVGNERILVIDDHEEIVDLLKQMLGKLGYKVTTRSCSFEACELFKVKADSFDLVITDLDMPNLSGMDVAAQFHVIRPDIPIILCSGFGDNVDLEKAQALGVQEFVKKPIIKREIAQKIRKLLSRHGN